MAYSDEKQQQGFAEPVAIGSVRCGMLRPRSAVPAVRGTCALPGPTDRP